MRLSCPEQMLGTRSLAEKIAIIEQAGFDGIDARFDTVNAPDFAGAMDQSSLPLVSVYSQLRAPSLLDATGRERAEAIAEVVRRARAAADHRALNLILVPVFGSPRLMVKSTDEEIAAVETALLLVSLKEIAAELGDTPIRVVLEPLNRDETHFLTDPTRAADLCQRLAEPRVATMVDTYHCHKEGQDPAAQVVAVGEQLALMHFSDSDRLLPGEGEVDFGAVLAALTGAGYEGWAGWECLKIESTEDVAALARSVTHVRNAERGVAA
ncbi:MAG: sugar phosphate isomerase/epimerase [Chloroflexota bacterium]|nr:sugar phosphate isomerase/epimerase [Chloroflexota bacterium]